MTLRISPDLALPVDAATGTFGILATKGAGKSNAAVVMAEEMYDAGVPWVAVDPKGDWWGIRADGDGKGAGLPIVVFGGRHGDVPLEPTAGALIADLVLEQRLSCVVDVSQFTKADTTRFLLAFGRRLFAHADDDGAEPLHLFLEEAHEYLPQVVRGDQAELVNVWQRIVKQGRFKGLGCTLISQRSSVLNKDVLELIDTLIVLRTMGPRSRKSISDWVVDQDVDPKLLASLPSLTDGEAWVWSPGALKILSKIRFRRRRTFDSGATPKVGQARRTPATLADVDLAAIKEQMADTIEKAKAEDPKELRRRIAVLERQLAERPTETKIETVEVPVIPKRLVELAANLTTQFGPIFDTVEEWVGSVEAFVASAAGVTAVDALPRSLAANERRPLEAAPKVKDRAPRRDIPAKSFSGDVTLPKGERLILTATAQHRDGVTRQQLTVLTGYKRSTRDAYLQRLRERDAITIVGGLIYATDSGLASLGDDFEPLPTGAALREHWLRELPEGERKILWELIAVYPDGMSRDDLTDRTDYKRSTRDAYLQRLRTRRLITTDGDPRAADLLFEETFA